jgi:hypothetical protein
MRRYSESIPVRTVDAGSPVSGSSTLGSLTLGSLTPGSLIPGDQLPDTPDQFIWNRHLWRVLVVQKHWVEAGQWWNRTCGQGSQRDDQAVSQLSGAGVPYALTTMNPTTMSPGHPRYQDWDPQGRSSVALRQVALHEVALRQSIATTPGRGNTGTDTHGGELDLDTLGEQSCWRVEASSGANGHTGIFELCHAGDSWTLRAVFD